MAATAESQRPGAFVRSALPLVCELTPVPEPVDALRRFADLPGTLLLQSADRRPGVGRYSFLAADPFRWFRCDRPTCGIDPLPAIADHLRSFTADVDPDLPPFQGGAAGLLSYELAGAYERLLPRDAAPQTPALAVGIYDWVIAWDHERSRAWVISHGFPETDLVRRDRRAAARLDQILAWLHGPSRQAPAHSGPSSAQAATVRPEASSNFTRVEYLRAVARIVEYIRAGDAFQVNLSQQLSAEFAGSPVELYARMAAVNPAPFAGYFASDDWAVVSASPERFLRVQGPAVETRPIKGTRPRGNEPAEDARLAAELLASEKDRAENVMIVDLLRNDLSRVCRPGTVDVAELCSLESYETVHHLVSAVAGTLETGKTAWDLLAASLPGGSITGAPKVRAMEIIRELEPAARGPYCGSLFYVGFDGAADSSLLIRTATVKGGRATFGVGGGVTAASLPEAEYDETLHKAAGMLRALDIEALRDDRS